MTDMLYANSMDRHKIPQHTNENACSLSRTKNVTKCHCRKISMTYCMLDLLIHYCGCSEFTASYLLHATIHIQSGTSVKGQL